MSELEQEFELSHANSKNYLSPEEAVENDEYSHELSDEDAEFESDEDSYEGETIESLNEEIESDDEFEEGDTDEEFGDEQSDDELEDLSSDDEFETDYASWSRDGIYDRDREFEQRIFKALVNHRDNELGLDMELDAVLHEMEREYFFGAAKKWLKKKGLGALKKITKYHPLSMGLKAVSAVGRGKIRSLLKNKLLQAAAGFIPIAGPLVSKAMSVAGSISDAADAAKSKIQHAVQIGKDAYEDLAESIPEAQNEYEVNMHARNAIRKAIARNPVKRHIRSNRSRRVIEVNPGVGVLVLPNKISINKGQKILPLKPGAVVSVKPGKVTIWETK